MMQPFTSKVLHATLSLKRLQSSVNILLTVLKILPNAWFFFGQKKPQNSLVIFHESPVGRRATFQLLLPKTAAKSWPEPTLTAVERSESGEPLPKNTGVEYVQKDIRSTSTFLKNIEESLALSYILLCQSDQF